VTARLWHLTFWVPRPKGRERAFDQRKRIMPQVHFGGSGLREEPTAPAGMLQGAAGVDGMAATLATAATAPCPRPRYRRGLRNRLNTWLLAMLPTRASDRVKRWIAGVAASAPAAAGGPDGAAPQPRRHRDHQGADAKGARQRTAPVTHRHKRVHPETNERT
jgi:hypothetical protein